MVTVHDSYASSFDPFTGQVNSFLTLSDSTTANTKIVECSQGTTGVGQTYKCEFCYSLGRSCQSSGSMTCMDVLPGPTQTLPVLAEGTYCYLARAVVNGSPTAMIQDSFSIRSCPNTGSYLLVFTTHVTWFT